MFRKAEPFFIKVVTPLHAGSGQELGIIDLPIQRERHTDFPKIEGSSLKGSIREAFEEKFSRNDKTIEWIFGPDNPDEEGHAGALGFTDARILLFPVKSMKGVFAYITCPMVIQRFVEDMALCGNNLSFTIPSIAIGECCVKAGNTTLTVGNHVLLEEYAFTKKDLTDNKLLTTLNKYTQCPEDKIILLSDDDFSDFVNLSTEVITRIKIDNETGTVQQGALFTEEYLPAETCLYSLALASNLFIDKNAKSNNHAFFSNQNAKEYELVLNYFKKNIPDYIQIGGNATIGKGIAEILSMKQ